MTPARAAPRTWLGLATVAVAVAAGLAALLSAQVDAMLLGTVGGAWALVALLGRGRRVPGWAAATATALALGFGGALLPGMWCSFAGWAQVDFRARQEPQIQLLAGPLRAAAAPAAPQGPGPSEGQRNLVPVTCTGLPWPGVVSLHGGADIGRVPFARGVHALLVNWLVLSALAWAVLRRFLRAHAGSLLLLGPLYALCAALAGSVRLLLLFD